LEVVACGHPALAFLSLASLVRKRGRETKDIGIMGDSVRDGAAAKRRDGDRDGDANHNYKAAGDSEAAKRCVRQAPDLEPRVTKGVEIELARSCALEGPFRPPFRF
jgi:hypothetical protein